MPHIRETQVGFGRGARTGPFAPQDEECAPADLMRQMEEEERARFDEKKRKLEIKRHRAKKPVSKATDKLVLQSEPAQTAAVSQSAVSEITSERETAFQVDTEIASTGDIAQGESNDADVCRLTLGLANLSATLEAADDPANGQNHDSANSASSSPLAGDTVHPNHLYADAMHTIEKHTDPEPELAAASGHSRDTHRGGLVAGGDLEPGT